jgi:hypothetical protein
MGHHPCARRASAILLRDEGAVKVMKLTCASHRLSLLHAGWEEPILAQRKATV